MQVAVILLMIIAFIAYYTYNRRWSIDQYVRSLPYDKPDGALKSELVAFGVSTIEMDRKLERRLLAEPSSVVEEFKDDLIDIYGKDRYLDRFEEDRLKWKMGKWTSPGLNELLRDIQLAKGGKIDSLCFDIGFNVGYGVDGMTKVRYRKRVEDRLREAGKDVRLHLLPVYDNSPIGLTFKASGKMVLEHQFVKHIDIRTLRKIGDCSRPWEKW